MNDMSSRTLTREAASPATIVSREALDRAIGDARHALGACQQSDGHFVFELEADATIPAEYVLMHHFRGKPADPALEAKIGNYLRRLQDKHGGWPLFHGADHDISASVKAYFALKAIGDDIDAPHMRRARDAILARGGAAATNVFTRSLLAFFGVVPWRAVPVMPVEIMLLPKWFPFHLDKVSYWARTVLVPLIVLMSLEARAKNPDNIRLDELFLVPPEKVRHWPKGPQQKAPWSQIFGAIDGILRVAQPWFPKETRQRAIERAVAFTIERLNGEDGLGAIFPAMVNSALMLELLGYPDDDPNLVVARRSIEKLLVVGDDEAYCQPCVSPVWDTALVAHTMLELGDEQSLSRAREALDWLEPRQVLDTVGDWGNARPHVRPGGWAFQYNNAHYPDLDDTAVVVMAMDRAARQIPGLGRDRFETAIARGREWIEGLQSRNGGYGAFDADNDHEYLNYIPFADHGALLDPPTEDVTARCISMLVQLGETPNDNPELQRAIDYLAKEQRADGSWYGRWGMNFIYGTWSVLCALNAAGFDRAAPMVTRAAGWLAAIQNRDGGWGEDGSSYKLDYKGYEPAPSTASQTAWAILGLMAAGQAHTHAVARGIDYLTRTQGGDGFWREERYTATGFPRVFYLRYHGYAKFFPLWALARYRNLMTSNAAAVLHGM